MTKLFETKWVESKFKLDNEMVVEFYTENYYYDKITIAKFNFYTNEGWVLNLNGVTKEVKRISTVLKHFEKLNFNVVNTKHYTVAQKNAKDLIKKEKEEYLKQLNNKSIEKMELFKNGIKNNDSKIIKVCQLMNDKDDEYLQTAIKNTFKYASKKELKVMFEIIRNYENYILLNNDKLDDQVNSKISVIDDEISNEDNSLIENKYYFNDIEFDNYSDAFSYCCDTYGKTYMIYKKNNTLSYSKLKKLEYEFKIKKRNMKKENALLLFNYLKSIPNSLDVENLYYKIKNYFNFN